MGNYLRSRKQMQDSVRVAALQTGDTPLDRLTMAVNTSPSTPPLSDAPGARSVASPAPGRGMAVALLTGGFDRPYAFGLSMALTGQDIRLEVLGSGDLERSEMHHTPGLKFFNIQPGWRSELNFATKLRKVLALYVRLIRYAIVAQPRVFHILWNNKLALFDRTILMLIYRACGRKILLTAHNVNAGKRDGTDSLLNRVTLRIQYHLVHHIFVHTQKMRSELEQDFRVPSRAVTVIPFGVNNAVPNTDLTIAEARRTLGLEARDRAILFFGNIRPYKGLEYLVEAFEILLAKDPAVSYRLIIAGSPPNGFQQYWAAIQQRISQGMLPGRVIQRIEYISDAETEVYFKASDLSVLPYTHIYQSGVLLLGYSFGLPAVATDVGSFSEDVVVGETGFLAKPCDAPALAEAIATYFASDLYTRLEHNRGTIQEFAEKRYSWRTVGQITRGIYESLVSPKA